MSAVDLVYQRISTKLGDKLTTFIGDPPEAAEPPYAFVWGPPLILNTPLAGDSKQLLDALLNVTVVHSTPNNVLLLAGQVRDALTGFIPEVDGWGFSPIRVTGSQPVLTPHSVVDTDTNRSPAWVVLHLRVRGQQA